MYSEEAYIYKNVCTFHMVFLVLLPKCPPYQSKRKKKKKEGQHSRKSSPEEEVAHLQKQKMRSPCALRDPSPKPMR